MNRPQTYLPLIASAAILALLALPGAAAAKEENAKEAGKKPNDTFYAIIMAGGTTPEPVTKAVADYKLFGGLAGIFPTEGFPQVVASATVSGLKPGFQVAILGYCAKEADAKSLREISDFAYPGTYLRKVKGEFDGRCPELRGLVPRYKMNPSQFVSRPLRNGNESIKWEVSWTRVPGCKNANSVVSRVVLGKTLLAEEFAAGSCTQADTERLQASCSYAGWVGARDGVEGARLQNDDRPGEDAPWIEVREGVDGVNALFLEERCMEWGTETKLRSMHFFNGRSQFCVVAPRDPDVSEEDKFRAIGHAMPD